MDLEILCLSFASKFLKSLFLNLGLSVQEKKRKIDFQDGVHFGFLI